MKLEEFEWKRPRPNHDIPFYLAGAAEENDEYLRVGVPTEILIEQFNFVRVWNLSGVLSKNTGLEVTTTTSSKQQGSITKIGRQQ
jgi:hypothetical protein